MRIRKPIEAAEYLLEILLVRAADFGAMADFEEMFGRIAEDRGIFAAQTWYFMHILIAIPGFFKQSIYWSAVMFRNYLITALRNLGKQKVFSLINIIGMAVGMAGFTLFALSAGTKLNAEKFHVNADRIFSVVQEIKSGGDKENHRAFLPAPAAAVLLSQNPEIESAVRIFPSGQLTFYHDKQSFYENNILFADSDFFRVFSFELISGNPNSALENPYTIVLSRQLASKYFGNENPLGKTITLENRVDVTVTGVLADRPRTSSMRFQCLISMGTLNGLSEILDDWKESRHSTFLLLNSSVDKNTVESRLPDFTEGYIQSDDETSVNLYLFPLLDFRLNSRHISSIMSSSFKASVFILIAFGTLMLLIVCVNFINLSTARHMYRFKEIGLRKVVGASRAQIMKQFIGESLIMSFLAIPLAILFYELIHPLFRSYLGLDALVGVSSVSDSIFNYPFLLKYLVSASLLTGIFSGAYPALFVSSFSPIQILKGSAGKHRGKGRGRKFLIVFQFALSIIFVAFAGIMKDQFSYFIVADFGYDRANIATLNVANLTNTTVDVLKAEILKDSDVEMVSAAAARPLTWFSKSDVRPEGGSDAAGISMESYAVDYGFIETMRMRLMQGRSFSQDLNDDNNFVLNEAAVKLLGWDQAIGKRLTVGEQSGTVIGTVENYMFSDIGDAIPPAVIRIDHDQRKVLIIRYGGTSDFRTLHDRLNAVWFSFEPEIPFEFATLESHISDSLGLLLRIAGVLNAIGFIAVFFSCLGLLGLTSFAVERRSKEIGIRKVLGASDLRLNWTLVKDFLLLVAIANIIALPAVYFTWKSLIQSNVLYLAEGGLGAYAVSAAISLLMALGAVTSQTFKAARSNPADTLRYE